MRLPRIVPVLSLGLGLALTSCHKDAVATQTPEPAPAPGAAAPAPAVDPLADIDARIEHLREGFEVPGLSVAIVKDGKVVHAKGYGLVERGKPEQIDADTTFAIASNTKAFLATLVGIQVHNGELGWDEKVKDHLKSFQMYSKHATDDMRIGNLLEHRSGLDTWAGDLAWIGSPGATTESLMKRLKHVEPRHGLRQAYGYTNLMFMVAGEVLREKTGKGWEVLVREQILDPLGMSRTTVSVKDLPNQENVATPHQTDENGEIIVPYLDVDMVGAAASLNSSANDMARWLLLQTGDGTVDGKEIVPAEVVKGLQQARTAIPVRENDLLGRHLAAYGRGWFLHDYAGHKVVSHGGGLPGMTSRTGFLPEIDLGVVVLTNSESSAATFIFQDIVDGYLGQERRDWPKVLEERKAAAKEKAGEGDETKEKAEPKPASADPKKYAGTYRQALLGKAVVTEKDGALRLDLPDHGGLDCPLKHTDADTYDCTWSNPIMGSSPVRFDVVKGKVKALRFSVRPEFIDPVVYEFRR